MRTRCHAVCAVVAATALLAASHAARAGEIQRRKQRQQNRIAAGIESGKLSPKEASRLETQEGALNREEQAMRDANGGHLGPGQRRVINRQQNRLSRRIFRQKHDGNDR
jgi:hypothetical protein